MFTLVIHSYCTKNFNIHRVLRIISKTSFQLSRVKTFLKISPFSYSIKLILSNDLIKDWKNNHCLVVQDVPLNMDADFDFCENFYEW